jgi:hypothetical protein
MLDRLSITPNPSDSSSPKPTATPLQPGAGSGVLFGLDWEKTAIVLLSIIIIVLVVIVLFSRRKVQGN